MNKKWLLLFPALALALAGCNQGGKSTPTSSSEQESVKAIVLDNTSATIEVRQSFQLNANVTPVTLSDRTVTWSSNNEAVATVNVSGKVTGVTPGTAKIRATSNFDNTKYAECDVTVTKHYVAFELDEADLTESHKFACMQENIEDGTRYYFTGEVDNSTRGVTSASLADAVDVKLEDAGNSKYHMSFTKEGENTKKYFEMSDDHHFAIVDTPTAGREWSWNEKAKTVVRTIGSTTYFPGTYNSFTTISGCDIAQLSGDFAFKFVDMVEEADPTAISIKEDSVTIRPYESAKLTAVIEPKGAAEAELVWSVTRKDGAEFDNKVTVKNGVVTVAGDAVKDTEYNVKCTWGNLEGDIAVVKVGEKLNYGSAEAPLTVKEAVKVINDSQNKKTATEMYVKGVGFSNTAYDSEKGNWGEIWLTDGTTEKAFEGYRLTDGSSDGAFATTYAAADSLFGKNVTMVGIGTLYGTTYEITSGKTSKLLNVEDAGLTPSGVKIDPAADFKLKAGAEKQLTAKIQPIGASAEVEWAVTLKDGSESDGKLTAVNGKVVAAADAVVGTEYKVTVTVKNTTFKATVGVVIDKPSAETHSVAKYTIVNEASTKAVTDSDTIVGWFSKVSGDAIVTSASDATAVYPGANGGKDDTAWESGNMLKIGKASDKGSLTLGLSTNVSKVVITGYGWKNDINVTVNGEVSNEFQNKLANKTSVAAKDTASDAFEFTASNSITISTAYTSKDKGTALCIVEIEFFAENA